MRFATVLIAGLSFVLISACSHATNGGSSSNASGKSGGDDAKKTGGSNATGGSAKAAAVPDPHASTSPNVGRQAGVGDDPSNLETADPKENGGDSGKPGPARKP